MKNVKDVLALCESWKGQREKIVDVYNAHRPLARGYKVKYEDALCATYVSALFIKLGLTELVPPECGAMQLARNMQALGRWADRAGHTPKPGELIFFDWQGDAWVDHVGLVTAVRGSKIVYSHIPRYTVTTSEIRASSRDIRGYGMPAYAEGEEAPVVPDTDVGDKTIKAGDLVTVKPGARWYTGAAIRAFVFARRWQVLQIAGDRAVLGTDQEGRYNIQSPIHVEDLVKADSAPQTSQEPETVTVTVTLPKSVYERYGSADKLAAALSGSKEV